MPGHGQRSVTLALFAHQDDEFAVLPLLAKAIRDGDRVIAIYATRNPDDRMEQVRQAETLVVLRGVGVDVHDIVFLGAQSGIFDGHAHERFEVLLSSLRRAIAATVGDRTTTACLVPAWEGGHQDHDAVHAAALVLANDGALASPHVREFPLYTAGGALPYRVMRLRPDARHQVAHGFSLREGIRWLWSIRHYRSQRRTFLALLPELVIRYLGLRRIDTRDACFDRVQSRPHPGRLFYERRFGVPYEDVAAAIGRRAWP